MYIKPIANYNIRQYPYYAQTAMSSKNRISFRGEIQQGTNFKTLSDIEIKDISELLDFNTSHEITMGNFHGLEIIKKRVPIFAKKISFTFEDYKNLSEEEKRFIREVNDLRNKNTEIHPLYSYRNTDTSVKKDAERLLYFAENFKQHLDNTYPQGYKLASIGRSLAPITETMSLIGADTVTVPFSKDALHDGILFPNSYYRDFRNIPYTKNDWIYYLSHFGIDKNLTKRTGKKLLFTDYTASEWTKKTFMNILKNLDFDMDNTLFLYMRELFLTPEEKGYQKMKEEFNTKHRGFCLSYEIDKSSYKKYASKPSVRDLEILNRPDLNHDIFEIYKHPELFTEAQDNLVSKLLRFSLYEFIHNIKIPK